jgi:phenylacetate-CoA ligase
MGAQAPFDEWTGCWRPDIGVDAQDLRRWQLSRAWMVAEVLAGDNPFYRGRIRIGDDRTGSAFRSLPFTTKEEVVADCATHPPYGSRSTCPAERIREFVETSGSTGRGKEVYVLDDSDTLAVHRSAAIGFWWAGVRPGTRVLLTLPVGVTAASQWYLGGLRLIGANVIIAGPYSTERKVDLMASYRAEVVVGTPTYVQRLALSCEAAGLDPASLGVRSLVVAGEPYTPTWAATLEQRWGGAVLYEQYGCTERVMAWTCPGGIVRSGDLGVLHFVPELSYWEVLDPASHQPVPWGGWGELITTPLDAWASPLLRFATRDRVQVLGPGTCPCGRPLPGIRGGSIQRYDDMMKVRGINVWPSAIDRAIFSVPGVVDYRGRITVDASGREIVEVTVESAADEKDLLTEVTRRIHEAIGLQASVVKVDPGVITGREPEGFVKVSRWRDDRRASRDPH